jgi:hypothetical protein
MCVRGGICREGGRRLAITAEVFTYWTSIMPFVEVFT